jgi:predicted NBD/HSP70 family sugar kinase
MKGRHMDGAVQVEEGMVGVMQDLRIATVERNAEVTEAYRHVRERTEAAAAQLQQEAAARDAQLAQMREVMAAAFSDLEGSLASAIKLTFERSAAAFGPLHGRLDEGEGREERFYAATVPDTIERLSGAHVREMEARREALVLDGTTTQAREARIVQRLERHVAEHEARAVVEAEDRRAQHGRVATAIKEQVRADAAG